jgi:hypothetical protein
LSTGSRWRVVARARRIAVTRNGYLILGAILLLLAIFVFWPGGGYQPLVAVYEGPAHERFTLSGFGYRQEVDGDQLVLEAGGRRLERRTDTEKVANFWKLWSRLRVEARGIRDGIGEDQLAAFGLDAQSPRLEAEGLSLSWSLGAREAFIYDHTRQRILRCQPQWLERIDGAARRLDQAQLFTLDQEITLLRVGAQTFLVKDKTWIDPAQPQRPALAPRVGDLAKLLFEQQLSDPVGADPGPEPQQRMEGAFRSAGGLQADWRLLEGAGGGWFLAVEGLPAQRIEERLATVLLAMDEELRLDRFFAIRNGLTGSPVEGLTVYLAGREHFTVAINRGGEEDDGESNWDLIWEGGRVRADAASPLRIADALNGIVVSGWSHRPLAGEWQPALEPGAVSLRLTLTGQPPRHLTISGQVITTDNHQATVVSLPPLLADLSLEQFLDPMIHNLDQTRIIKLQRLGPGGGEVFVLNEDRGWERSYPQRGPVVSGAMEQLLAALTHLRAESVRLQGAEDQAILAAPELEIDARIAARDLENGEDDVRVEHTIERDWGMALRREGDVWRAVDKENGLSYVLAGSRVQDLFRPLDRPLLLPLVASQLARIAIEREDGVRYELQRQAGTWVLRAEGYRGPADETQLRRFLNLLGDAGYEEALDQTRAIDARRRLGSLRATMTGDQDRPVTWVLEFASDDSDLLQANVVRDDGEDAGEMRGSYRVDPRLFELCCPDPQSLAPATAAWDEP